MFDAVSEIAYTNCYTEIAAAAEGVADQTAKDFVTWYNQNSAFSWARELSTDQMYEQFKMTL